MAKDVIILCLDTSPSMNLDPLNGGDTALQMSLRVARQLVQKRMFAGGKDLVGLVLFGTEDTDNMLASREGGYENISELYPPSNPTVEFLTFLTTQIKSGNTSADFVDAVVVSMDSLITALDGVKKVGEKMIYLLTDAGSEFSDDQVDQICTGLRINDIDLIVIGPNIDDANGSGDGGGPGDGPGPSHRRPYLPTVRRKQTSQQVAGESMIGQMIMAAEGTCYSFHEALQASTFIRKNAKRQTTRFAGQLVVGDRLKIPCKIFTKVMIERPDMWKKLSALSQASASDGTMGIKLQRTYHRNDEDETEVENDNVAKGYRYGNSLIPISEADEKAMKFEATRCLSLMGFTKGRSIRHHQLIGTSVQVVVPNPGDENGARALSGLIHALFETDMVGVARYVWRKDSQPKLVALVPKIKAESECLLMLQLPFMEDMRQFVFGSLPGERKNAQPSDEQLLAVDRLLTNMDLVKADLDEDGLACEALQPKRTCNPVIQRTFQCIAHRALNPDKPLPEVDEPVQSILQPSSSLLASCSSDLQRIKELFPLEKVVKKAKENGATAEVWKKTSDLDLDGPPQTKRHEAAAGENKVDFSMASLARGAVTKVGTLDPVSDYRMLVGKGDFTIASKQLQKVALDLVKESFGDSHYEKALDCIKSLREETIKQGQAEVFNQFLCILKDELHGTRYSPFWGTKVAGGGVTLVSSSESSSSSISPEQAAMFITDGVFDVGVRGSGAMEDDMEDPDNLLDLM